MKKYNNNPAINYLSYKINKNARCYKATDDKICSAKGLTCLDFLLWYDETFLTEKLDFKKSVFDFILYLTDRDGLCISSSTIKNNFRLACLIYNKFVNADEKEIKKMSAEYLKDNPVNDNYINWESIIDYDKKGNKVMFPFFRQLGISDKFVAELVSRQLLAFDNKFRNLVFICSDSLGNRYGLEKHGITSKHFMRLEGDKFPFCYWVERGNEINFKNINNIVLYSDTLEMLEEISTLIENDEIDYNTVYASLHTKNFHSDCLDNLLKLCSENVRVIYNFYLAEESEEKESIKESGKLEIVNYPFAHVSYEELQFIKNNKLTPLTRYKKTFKYYPDGENTNLSFDEIIKLPQMRHPDGTVSFILNSEYDIDLLGRKSDPEELPF